MSIPKATHTGTLFDGLLDCYVLDDERRMVTNSGTIQLLNGGGAEGGNLSRYTGRLPQKYSHLASGPEVEFSLPGGGKAKGHEATWLVELLKAYDEADDEGLLHHAQRGLAKNCRKVLRVLADIGIVALIDEATGYQRIRRNGELAFIFRALLLDSTRKWEVMFDQHITKQIMALHGDTYTGGAQPRYLGSTWDKIYRLVLTDDVVDELKRRNPQPAFGTNHHQWLTPEAREIMHKQIELIALIAENSVNKEDFWARMEHRYADRPLQMHFGATRGAAE